MISLVKRKLEDEIDELFQLPQAEFTSARNALAARLKKEGRPNEAERVKLLGKPSVSAWAVNQLYWDHREAFDELIATGKRFRRGAAAGRPGKVANMRENLDARRDALVHLSELAADLLRDAGHNPSPDTIHRVTTTLEALSAYALLADGPSPGRLTGDVDPPSFESLASLMSGGVAFQPEALQTRNKSNGATAKAHQKTVIADVRKLQQAKIAAAKVALQDAKRALTDARTRAQSLEKLKRDAEQRLAKASTAAKEAARRAQSVTAEADEASQVFADAKKTLDSATRELETLVLE